MGTKPSPRPARQRRRPRAPPPGPTTPAITLCNPLVEGRPCGDGRPRPSKVTWGQPPSAVQPSAARQLPAVTAILDSLQALPLLQSNCSPPRSAPRAVQSPRGSPAQAPALSAHPPAKPPDATGPAPTAEMP